MRKLKINIISNHWACLKTGLKLFGKARMLLTVAAGLFLTMSCNKTVTVPEPVTSVNSENVYKYDYTAISAVTGIYTSMSNTFETGGPTKISVFAGLSADELSLYDFTSKLYNLFYYNQLTAINGSDGGTWNNLYQLIYQANAAIEGLSASTTLTSGVKEQLLGEAKFCRAFFYFYLTNLYGDVPLALSTDYKVNSSLMRSSADAVYSQIINDLKDAQSLLNANYVAKDGTSTTTERVRPSKGAATALLARVYLYRKDYNDAVVQSTAVISNKSIYDTVGVNETFLKNSKETIWSLQPVRIGLNTAEAKLFVVPSTGFGVSYPIYLSSFLVNSFESGDRRKASWIGELPLKGKVYHYAYKYKAYLSGQPVTEYSIVMRLAEMYLVRSEAQAQLGNTADALSDLNVIRRRAGLAGITATDKTALLLAIEKERQTELFTEWGHRWLDLKRTGRVDAVMSVVAPEKSSVWNTHAQLYPIPSNEIMADGKLTQNPGY